MGVVEYGKSRLLVPCWVGVGNALKLPCPPNIRVFWNGGSLLGITVGIQIATGLILRIRYNRDASMAFGVVLGISRESDFG